jgi:hypothetical protein
MSVTIPIRAIELTPGSNQLKIYILQNGDYAESSVSSIFPNLPITEMIPQLVQKAIDSLSHFSISPTGGWRVVRCEIQFGDRLSWQVTIRDRQHHNLPGLVHQFYECCVSSLIA